MASLGGESTIPFGPALEKNGGMHLLANIRCVPRTFYTCELSKFYLHYSRTRRRIPIPSIRSSFYKGMTDPLCILQPMGIPLQISLSIPLLRMGCWVGATSESSSHFAPLSLAGATWVTRLSKLSTSNQARLRAELKHITKRRKRK